MFSTTPADTLLSRPFNRYGGHCWSVDVGGELPEGTTLLLFEDGRPLGPPWRYSAEIQNRGGGGYTLWKNHLLFSTSDNSPADTNGRVYTFRPLSDKDIEVADAFMESVKGGLDVTKRCSEIADEFAKYLHVANYSSILPKMVGIKKFSMLHTDVLLLLNLLAGQAVGRIVEIGPYLGGSTVAMALGVEEGSSKLLTVESGGAYTTHPQLPTDNILRDLRENVNRYKLNDRVEIIEGLSALPGTIAALRDNLGGEKISLLFIDADGCLERDLRCLSHFIGDGCILVADDYLAEEGLAKQALVKRNVDSLVEDGCLEEIGVYGYGTWFGRIRDVIQLQNRPAPDQTLARLVRGEDVVIDAFVAEQGFCQMVSLPWLIDLSDDESGSTRSPLVLSENGVPLGPAHSIHADIREHGEGRYSHWKGTLRFSTSDNSSPLTNGRRYTIRLQRGQT